MGPLPVHHTQYILRHGKKAYREWVGQSGIENETAIESQELEKINETG